MPWVAGAVVTWTSSAASLSNTYTSLTSNVQNTGFIRVRVTLTVTFGSAPAAGTAVYCWILKDTDGTGSVLEDGATGTPGVTPARAADIIFPCETATSSQVLVAEVEWPYGYTGLEVLNSSGQAMSSGWSLKGLPIDYK